MEYWSFDDGPQDKLTCIMVALLVVNIIVLLLLGIYLAVGL